MPAGVNQKVLDDGCAVGLLRKRRRSATIVSIINGKATSSGKTSSKEIKRDFTQSLATHRM
jgi:hypothetical protein